MHPTQFQNSAKILKSNSQGIEPKFFYSRNQYDSLINILKFVSYKKIRLYIKVTEEFSLLIVTILFLGPFHPRIHSGIFIVAGYISRKSVSTKLNLNITLSLWNLWGENNRPSTLEFSELFPDICNKLRELLLISCNESTTLGVRFNWLWYCNMLNNSFFWLRILEF